MGLSQQQASKGAANGMLAWLTSPGAQKRKNHCVAIIGDGAITGGMAYEAMNHAGYLDKNMIVVLNDNQQVSPGPSTLADVPAGCIRS